jgi:hypothetical protein
VWISYRTYKSCGSVTGDSVDPTSLVDLLQDSSQDLEHRQHSRGLADSTHGIRRVTAIDRILTLLYRSPSQSIVLDQVFTTEEARKI